MSDREDQSNLPPIPDGGLTDAMPEWLRRPPAWRTLPDREVMVPEPENASDLPEPDESIIDPRTFLTDDDLPAWLRRLGPGRALRSQDGDHAEPGDEHTRLTPSDATEPDSLLPAERRTAASPSRFRPTSPPVAPALSRVDNADQGVALRQRPIPPEPAQSPAWQGAWVVAVLAALLVVALSVIVVLVL